MKRLLLLTLNIVAITTLTILPVSAAPAKATLEDLTALAAYIPGDTIFFGATRIDDGYIDELDDAFDRLEALFPGMIPPTGLRDQLNALTKNLGGDFEQVFGSWLGDTAAFGIYDLDQDALMYADMDDSFTVAIEITEAQGPEAYFDSLVENGTLPAEKNIGGGVISYDIERSNTSIIIALDVLLFTQPARQADRSARLISNSRFTDALVALPEDEYNIVLYIDMGAYLQLSMDIAMINMPSSRNMPENPMLDMFDSMGEAFGGAAIGFTILDERSFVIDMSTSFDMDAYVEAFGIDPSLMTIPSIDPAFVRHIPAGTPLFVQGANLSNVYDLFLAGMEYAAQTMSANIPGTSAEDIDEELEQMIAQIEFMVRGVTGLTIDEVFGWMTSDYALWFGVSPRLMDTTNPINALMEGLPLDFGLVVDASPDPEAAAALVGGLAQAFELLTDQMAGNRNAEVTLSTETIAGTEAVLLTIRSNDLPFPIRLGVASNDDVFVLGTHYAVQAALNPTNGLDADPRFQEALTYALPNTTTFMYASGAGFNPLIDILESLGSRASDVALARGFLDLLHSSSITQVMNDGTTASRFVITLPE